MNGTDGPLRIVMAPDWRSANPYLNLLAKSVTRPGVEAAFSEIPLGLFALTRLLLKAPGADVLHLHWVNRLIEPVLWSRHGWVRGIKRVLFSLDLFCARLLPTRIVWTIHNLVSHDAATPQAAIRLRAMLARAVDRLIVHSPSALSTLRVLYGPDSLPNEKVSVVRHGNYFGCYAGNATRAQQLRRHWNLAPEHAVVLFFGNVKPYKGIERLMAAFAATSRSDLRCIVAGKPATAELRATLEQAARTDPRILLALDFIPDEDVAAYFEVCDVVAIPFEKTLTSGSAVLAMSEGKAVMLPEEGLVLDLGGRDSILYFKDDEDLALTLQALEKQTLERMGGHNRHLAKRFDWHLVGEQTLNCYKGRVAESPSPRTAE